VPPASGRGVAANDGGDGAGSRFRSPAHSRAHLYGNLLTDSGAIGYGYGDSHPNGDSDTEPDADTQPNADANPSADD
jgi:hypothetical protein